MNQITEIFKLIIYPIDREHQHSSSCTTTDVASRLLNTLGSSPSITSQVLLHQHPNNNTGLVVRVWGCGQTAVQREAHPLYSPAL
jgi:hypothetical protein